MRSVRILIALCLSLICLAARPVAAAESPKQGDVFENSLKMKLVYIPAGEFEMGSPGTETERSPDEKLHHLKLT